MQAKSDNRKRSSFESPFDRVQDKLRMSGHRLLLIPLFVVAMAMLPSTVLAADPITATVDDISIKYPDEIVFKASASSTGGNVTALNLHVVVGGGPGERSNTVPITAGANVNGEYHMKTSMQNYLAPGTDLTYWLDAQDSGGNKLTTLKQLFWYADTRFQWQKHQDGTVTVYYYGNALDAAKLVATAAHDDQVKGGALLGVQARSFKVMLYNTARDIIGAQPIEASQTSAQNLIREGIAYSTEELVQVLNTGQGTADTARHEITHLYVGWVGGSGVPAWLNEGMAVWSQKSHAEYDAYLKRAVSNNTLHLVRGLEGYSGTPESILQAYGEGASIVTLLIDKYGGDKFRQLIEAHKTGEGTEAALKRLYNLDMNQLDAQWRESLGAPSRTYESALPTPIAVNIPPMGVAPSGSTPGGSGSQSGPSGSALPPLLPVVGGAIAVMVLAAGGLALIRRRES